MSGVVSFGIGCFIFGVKKTPPFKLTGEEYLEELQKALEAVPNISNLNIFAGEDFRTTVVEVTEPLPRINEGFGFFPHISEFLEITFDIYIPTRLQEPITSLQTERFRVHMRNPWYFPVTFVELLAPRQNVEAADAVIVVRDFLRNHFKEAKNDFIRFELLGPSPFHAHFFLTSSKNLVPTEAESTEQPNFDRYGFEVRYIPDRGYGSFRIVFNHTVYKNSREALEELFTKLESEASFFYSLILYNVIQMGEWHSVKTSVDEIIELKKAKGFKALWQRFTGLSRKLRDIIFELAEFESNQIQIDYEVKSSHRGLLRDETEPYLDAQIKNEIADFGVYPFAPLRELVMLLEEQRSKQTENLVIIISAIVGGVVGSIITLLFATP
jgi:hypothetical protein